MKYIHEIVVRFYAEDSGCDVHFCAEDPGCDLFSIRLEAPSRLRLALPSIRPTQYQKPFNSLYMYVVRRSGLHVDIRVSDIPVRVC